MDKWIKEHSSWNAHCWPDIIKKGGVSKFYWGFSEGKAQWTDFLELLQLLNYEKRLLLHRGNVAILLLREHKFCSLPKMFSI